MRERTGQGLALEGLWAERRGTGPLTQQRENDATFERSTRTLHQALKEWRAIACAAPRRCSTARRLFHRAGAASCFKLAQALPDAPPFALCAQLAAMPGGVFLAGGGALGLSPKRRRKSSVRRSISAEGTRRGRMPIQELSRPGRRPGRGRKGGGASQRRSRGDRSWRRNGLYIPLGT